MSREGMIPRNYQFLISAVILVILTQGCGLNNYPYIKAPTVRALNGSSGVFSIFNRDDNDPDIFQGYELYYKFYDAANSQALRETDYNSLFSVEEPEPADIIKLGFKRINTVSTINQRTPYPMIPIDYSDRDNYFEIKIDFSAVDYSINQVIPKVSYLSNDLISLFRVVIDPDHIDSYKSFIVDDLSIIDTDISSVPVTLSLFVFSYGKYDRVYNIYSKPVWLGYIDYDYIEAP